MVVKSKFILGRKMSLLWDEVISMNSEGSLPQLAGDSVEFAMIGFGFAAESMFVVL